jgi:hypothetical protein
LDSGRQNSPAETAADTVVAVGDVDLDVAAVVRDSRDGVDDSSKDRCCARAS